MTKSTLTTRGATIERETETAVAEFVTAPIGDKPITRTFVHINEKGNISISVMRGQRILLSFHDGGR